MSFSIELIKLAFRFFREYMDSVTVLGYYLSIFFFTVGAMMYLIINIASMGFYISLSLYMSAFFEDFKNIISEMNDELISENRKNSKSQSHNNDSSSKLKQAIFLHNEMIKYFVKAISRLNSILIFKSSSS